MEATQSMVFCSASNLIQIPNRPNSPRQQRIPIQLGLGRYKSESLKSTQGNLVSARLGLTTLWKMQAQKRTTCVLPEIFVQHTFICHHVTPTTAATAAAAALIWRGLGPKMFTQIWPLSSHGWSSVKPTGPLPIRSGILSTLTLGPWEPKLMYCSKASLLGLLSVL